MATLQRGGNQRYAVTVAVAGGGGTTVSGMVTSGLDAAAATSVCSSLESQACMKVEATPCESYGGSSSAARADTVPRYILGIPALFIFTYFC